MCPNLIHNSSPQYDDTTDGVQTSALLMLRHSYSTCVTVPSFSPSHLLFANSDLTKTYLHLITLKRPLLYILGSAGV
jgi:hypothetical protein